MLHSILVSISPYILPEQTPTSEQSRYRDSPFQQPRTSGNAVVQILPPKHNLVCAVYDMRPFIPWYPSSSETPLPCLKNAIPLESEQKKKRRKKETKRAAAKFTWTQQGTMGTSRRASRWCCPSGVPGPAGPSHTCPCGGSRRRTSPTPSRSTKTGAFSSTLKKKNN